MLIYGELKFYQLLNLSSSSHLLFNIKVNDEPYTKMHVIGERDSHFKTLH